MPGGQPLEWFDSSGLFQFYMAHAHWMQFHQSSTDPPVAEA
jgi:hypothetical protein